MKRTNIFILALFLMTGACGGDPSDPTDADTDTDTTGDTTPDGDSYGALSVISTPEGAQVKLDSSPVGTTPLLLEELVPGDYNVEISKTGYKTYSEGVTISEDYTTPLEITLEPESTLDLTGRWIRAEGSVTCDVTHTGDQVSGFEPIGTMTLSGNELSFSDTYGSWANGEVIDNDHVSLTSYNAASGVTSEYNYSRL